MLKEEMIYEDALEVLEKSLKGETVNQFSLTVATLLLQNAFTKIYENRVQAEVAKKADEWKSEIE